MTNAVNRQISHADAQVQCDALCKHILANKIFLAWILKYTMTEFRTLSIPRIITLIEDEPQVAELPVNPGATNADFVSDQTSQRITGITNESTIPHEGTATFDIRFCVYRPRKKKQIKLIINVESQKSFNPGYHLVTRGIFYGARMLSAQLTTEFKKSEYDNMKKVCSIWICMNAPAYIGNAISQYNIHKKDIVPGIPDQPKSYDKLSVVMVCLNRNSKNKNKLTSMLNVLFSTKIQTEDKIRILDEKFHIPEETYNPKEVNEMCNISEYFEECGLEEGLKKGREQGLEQGRQEERESIMRSYILASKEDGVPNVKIIENLQRIFMVTLSQAEKYFKQYAK